MKKSLILAGMLSIGYAYAQEGRVGINTSEPKATIDIQPSATNLTGTTNEGILAPRLSKVRVANISEPKQGTLVYVLDENSTENPDALISAYVAGTNTAVDNRVAKITEKGYYFYNGTEWVKAGANGELWAQRDNSGVTETYLKPAETDGNKVYYSDKGVTNLLGSFDENATWETNNTIAYKFDEVPNFTGINSSKFKQKNTMANGSYMYSFDLYKLSGKDAVNGTGKGYTGKTFSLSLDKDVSTDLGTVTGQNISISNQGTGKTNHLVGLDIYTFMGAVNGNSPETTYNIAAGFNPRILKGKADNVTGVWVYPRIYGGELKKAIGSNILINTSEILNGITSAHPTMNYESVLGYAVNINNKINTTAKHLAGADLFAGYENGSTAEYGYSLIARGNVAEGAKVDNYHGVVSYLGATGAGNVKNVYGFKYNANFADTFKPENEYGLWIDNVDNGTANNFAIHTGAGKVRVGDLAQSGAGDRVVYADENGVLKTGVSAAANVKLATGTNAVCEEATSGTMNFGSVTINGDATEAFGFCMKNSTGEYKWFYIYGGAGVTTGNGGAFGAGL